MSLCGEDTLRNDNGATVATATLFCGSWNCETCIPKRRSKVFAQASRGIPTRFITLTCNPRLGESPEGRRASLAKGLARLALWARRHPRIGTFEYFAVCEAHESGEPHVHVLVRCPYFHWKLLRAMWRRIGVGVITDIRKVKNANQAIRYVAKYVAKKPAQFGFAKRYWQSRGYQLPEETEWISPLPPGGVTYRAGMRPLDLHRQLISQFMAGKHLAGNWTLWTPLYVGAPDIRGPT